MKGWFTKYLINSFYKQFSFRKITDPSGLYSAYICSILNSFQKFRFKSPFMYFRIFQRSRNAYLTDSAIQNLTTVIFRRRCLWNWNMVENDIFHEVKKNLVFWCLSNLQFKGKLFEKEQTQNFTKRFFKCIHFYVIYSTLLPASTAILYCIYRF